MSTAVVIIPARYDSERLPGKPLAEIAGKPMIQHVAERAARARLVGEVLVATDDARIERAVRAFGGRAVMTPRDIRSGSDRIAHVARTLADAPIVVNVQGDEPLIEPALIDEIVAPLLEDPALTVVTPVREVEDARELQEPGTVKAVLDRRGDCLYFSRAVIPHVRDGGGGHRYYQHIGLYAYRREFLLAFAAMPETPLERAERLEQLRILEHGHRIRAVITTHRSLPVDTPADLDRVRRLLTP